MIILWINGLFKLNEVSFSVDIEDFSGAESECENNGNRGFIDKSDDNNDFQPPKRIKLEE